MNFFKLYIGDYQRDTGSLSIAEHGAYMLMLQHLYATEKPLPTGRELYRLLRADSKIERDAIDKVAKTFWQTTSEGGLVNERALEEIRKSEHQRTVNRAIGKLGGRPKKTETAPSPPHEGITDSVTDSVSVRYPNRNPNHSHIEQEQDQELKAAPHARSPQDPRAPAPTTTDAGRACRLLREAGCARVNPSHPDLLAALAEGVSPESLVHTYGENPTASNPFAWAIATARGRHAEGAKAIATGPPVRGYGPPTIGKTAQALHALEAMKHGTQLDQDRDCNGLSEAHHPRLGADPCR